MPEVHGTAVTISRSEGKDPVFHHQKAWVSRFRLLIPAMKRSSIRTNNDTLPDSRGRFRISPIRAVRMISVHGGRSQRSKRNRCGLCGPGF